MSRPLLTTLSLLLLPTLALAQDYEDEWGLPVEVRNGQPTRVEVGGQAPEGTAPEATEIGNAPAVGTPQPQPAPQVPNAQPLPRQGYDGTYVTRSQDGRRTEAVTTVTRRADGRYDVIRRVRTSAGDTYQLEGWGQVRRGLLLVEYGEPQPFTGPAPDVSGNLPGGEGQPSDGGQPGQPNDSGGIIGALDGDGGNTPADDLPAPNALNLTGSVGLGGQNTPDDVKIVQEILTAESLLDPTFTPGVADAALNEAIRRFQIKYVGYREAHMTRSDPSRAITQRVDPGSATEAALGGKRLGERAFVIYSSVGAGGTNNSPDVKIIQEALILGGFVEASQISYGQNSPALEAAIRRYQIARAGFRVGDSRVDINHRTLAALNGESFAVVEDALAPPGDMPLGEPLEDDPGAGPADETVGETVTLPPSSLLPPQVFNALPPVPEGVSVAAYKVEDFALQAMVHDRNAANGWVFEHGVALVEATGVK